MTPARGWWRVEERIYAPLMMWNFVVRVKAVSSREALEKARAKGWVLPVRYSERGRYRARRAS